MKIHDKQLRQRLSGFLLRHGRIYEGKRRWTGVGWSWNGLALLMEEYAAAVRAAQARSSSNCTRQRKESGRSGPSARRCEASDVLRRSAELDDI